ncbi:hypothetical protein Mapa_013252 [Marchantia paleacea]|nr:hypothetical protein Mapa_013252 [Marchantia paleacea]
METTRGYTSRVFATKTVRPLWRILLAAFSVTVILEPVPALGFCNCPTGFFNFGDSLTDTGNNANAFPVSLNYELPPYGENFFRRPSKRVTNGRVVPDFFSLAFRKPLLQPYTQVGAFDYRHGVNFAASGATASTDQTHSPFYLSFQIAQFVTIKQTAEAQIRQSQCFPFDLRLPRRDVFQNALYTIEIGGNDIIYANVAKRSPSYILNVTIPGAMKNFADGVKTLYKHGARRFLFFQIPNAGCSTIIATLFGEHSELDDMGCVKVVNELDQAYNAALRSTVESLRAQFPDASMDVFDYYGANLEILKNPVEYGFNPSLTKTACCGASGVGPYNYNPSKACGLHGSSKCANPEEYVNWDGVHFTEAFYRIIAKFALSGKYTDLGIDYSSMCHLDYSLFGSSVTYDEAYPGSCKVALDQESSPVFSQTGSFAL